MFKNIICVAGAICLSISINVDAYANQQQLQPVGDSSSCRDIKVIAASTTYNGNICCTEAVFIGNHAVVNGNVKSQHAVTLGDYAVVTGSVTSDCNDIITGTGSSIVGPTNSPTEYVPGAVATSSPTNNNVNVLPTINHGDSSSPSTSTTSSDASSSSSSLPTTKSSSTTTQTTSAQTISPSSSSSSHQEGTATAPATTKPCVDITNVVASTIFNGDICSHAAFTSGANSIINGNVYAVADITLGSNSIVNGDVHAKGDVTMGQSAVVTGNVVSDSHVLNIGAGARYNTNQSAAHSLIMRLKQITQQ